MASYIHREKKKEKKKKQRRLDSWITYNDFGDIYTGGFSVNGGNVCLAAVRRKPAKLQAWELRKSERNHWWRRAVVPEILFLESFCRVGKRWHLKLTKPAFKLTLKFVTPKNSLKRMFQRRLWAETPGFHHALQNSAICQQHSHTMGRCCTLQVDDPGLFVCFRKREFI